MTLSTGTPTARNVAYLEKLTVSAWQQQGQSKRLWMVLAVSGLLNLVLGLVLLTKTDHSRTVILAPGAEESYVVTANTVSENLLERFAIPALNLVLNITPATSQWQINQFLESVAPESHGDIALTLTRGAESLKRNQASLAFFPKRSAIDVDKQTVCVTGERKTLLAKTVTSSEEVTACLKTTVRMGRLWIVQLTLTNGGDTTGTLTQRTDQNS